MLSRPAGRLAPATDCRWCGAALDTPARHRGLPHCPQAACRAREATERLRQRRERTARSLRAAAAREQPVLVAAVAAAVGSAGSAGANVTPPTTLPGALPATVAAELPVVWLRPAQRRLLPLSEAERTAHAAHLQRVLTEDLRRPDWHGHDDSASADTPQARALCTQCRGACCAVGGPNHAFVDVTVLRRWLDAHPGRSEEDAIQTWLDWLPPRHVEGACLYQGPRGCVLQRGWRAQVCNAYYCESLQQVQAAARSDPAAPVLAITAEGDRVRTAALLTEGRITALRSRGRGGGQPDTAGTPLSAPMTAEPLTDPLTRDERERSDCDPAGRAQGGRR